MSVALNEAMNTAELRGGRDAGLLELLGYSPGHSCCSSAHPSDGVIRGSGTQLLILSTLPFPILKSLITASPHLFLSNLSEACTSNRLHES